MWWMRQHRAHQPVTGMTDALLLLGLVLLLRAALDPWNNLYYHVPFLFALLAYEIRSGRMPLMTVVYSFVLLIAFLIIVPLNGHSHLSFAVRGAIYAATVVPMIGWMVAKLYQSAGVRDTGSRIARALPGKRLGAVDITAG
jgi:hypothetical protein